MSELVVEVDVGGPEWIAWLREQLEPGVQVMLQGKVGVRDQWGIGWKEDAMVTLVCGEVTVRDGADR